VRVHDDTGLWFDACDRAGIMVFTGGYSTGGYDYSLPVVRDVIMVAKNHPSVCVYVTGNEWDDAQIATDAKLMYNAVKAIDPSRLQFIAWTGSYYNGSNPKSIQEQIGSDFLDYHTYGGWYSGESYAFYNYHSSESFPVTISECVGAYTNKDPNGGGFFLSGTGHSKSLGAALRKIGHSYNWNEDSLAYQSWLAGEVTETCRRDRSTTRSMCGPVPFTDSYAYEYSYNPDDKTEYPKPVIDRLAKAYEPVHISILNTAPNQYAGNTMAVTAFVLNDDCTHYYPALPPTTLSFNLLDAAGTSVWSGSYAVNSVNYYATWSKNIVIAIPESLSTGKYTLRAKLSLNSNDLSITDSDIFVASQSWTRIVHTGTALVAVYDTSGQTITELEGLGVPLAVISDFSNLIAYGKLIIGKDSFNATVAGAESSILSFINSGKRVLILEQNSTDSKNAFNASGWLGTGLSYYATAGYGEPFVNIERPYLNTLMNDLKRSDFSNWNNMATGEPQDRDLYSRPIVMGYNDMDHCAVLANAGSHLYFPVLVEIFPIGGTGGSCILSQLYTVGRNTPDSKATKYLANLVDYLIEEQAHYQYITAEPTIKFGDFKSERGVIFSSALQGMSVANSGDWKGERDGRTFVGEMNPTSLRLYEKNPASTEICPLYLRSSYPIGSDIIVDVGNNHTAALNYTLYVNGQATTTKQVTPGTRQQDTFGITPIAAGTNVKLEIEADEGGHFDTYDTGLIFHSIKLYDPNPADFNYDGKINLFDFAELALGWGEKYNFQHLTALAQNWLGVF